MKGLGYGKGYQYAHEYDDTVVSQHHLPDTLRARRYYKPSERGAEKDIRQRMTERNEVKKKKPQA
jgi:putative ATPase